MSDKMRAVEGEWRRAGSAGSAGACAPRTGQVASGTGRGRGERREVQHSMLRRCFNWDYTQPCIYQITIVLAERGSKALGEIVVDEVGEGGRPIAAHCELTELGRAILEHWLRIGEFTPEIKPLYCQIMPDHLHAILRVVSPMKRPLGNAIGGFKTGCEKIYRKLALSTQDKKLALSTQDKKLALLTQDRGLALLTQDRGLEGGAGSVSAAQAAEPPRLFGPGFQDTILFHEGQLDNMFNYLRSNPLRLAIKRWAPALFRASREIEVSLGTAGVGHFAALGNHFLLDRPLVQVQVSRRFFGYKRVAKPGGGLKIAKDEKGEPIAEFATPEFEERRNELFAAAKHGAVLLSPCVSDGERRIAREALAAGLPLVTMANKGFSRLQKPGGRHFDACAAGKLLMLAPAAWPYQPGEKPMTRFDATAMNRLCQWIAGACAPRTGQVAGACAPRTGQVAGAAEINYHGMKPTNIDALARAAARVNRVGER